MIICATGHRPNKLGGYGENAHSRLVSVAHEYLATLQPLAVISGMALGWDIAFAEAAHRLHIPVHAAIPFAGQESKWPAASRIAWQRLVDVCASVTVVSSGGYSAHKMQVRNEWMVDRANRVCALWDGSAGGTNNCLSYARTKGHVSIDNLWGRLV